MIRGGIDAVQIETCQDLLQTKAAVLAAVQARQEAGRDIPILASVTVETTGTMLLGTETAAALTGLQRLGIDAIGLNCATGPDEMREHLRLLANNTGLTLTAMPNAGLPELTPTGARYPLGAEKFATDVAAFVTDYGLGVVGGCCGTTPEHVAQLAQAVSGQSVAERDVAASAAVSSLYQSVPLSQDTSYLAVGERTNAAGSKAFREALLADDWDTCLDIAKAQARDGAHVLDVCVDYVGRDGRHDMAEVAARLATGVTMPIMLDSTEPEVLRVGLETLAGRCLVNSVNFEDGDGPESRFAKIMPLVRDHGAAVVALTIDEQGQARDQDTKVAVAARLIEELTGNWGLAPGDILVDCLTFPIATGQEETRRDAIATLAAISEIKRRYPGVRTILGVSNVSFGLNPAARQVLNSVFLHEAVTAGLDAAIINSARILPLSRLTEQQHQVALDLIYDRRTASYDPLQRFLELFEGVTAASSRASRAAELAALPLAQRLQRRIVDGDAKGLTDDLDEALQTSDALSIINNDLLAGMKTVGELFGSGAMQLPFVLQSAEVMKAAVSYLEPQLESAGSSGSKGTLVLATVKGDVHDIGKNLVDIIVSNNGYTVINVGIKQPMQAIIAAAEEHQADAIGMSGLLVKSTLVMKDNLLELNRLGLADRFPVLLGGAALTRTFVEHDLADMFDGEVRYAKDAFEGLALMDTIMAVHRGEPGAELPKLRRRRFERKTPQRPDLTDTTRSDVARGLPVPTPPFWGSRVVRGVRLAEVAAWLDHRATFLGQWGLKPSRGGASYDELVAEAGWPRLRMWLDRIAAEQIAQFAVVYGYWPVHSSGNTLVIGDPTQPDRELTRFEFPRQSRDRRLCLADFFRDESERATHGPDVLALQLVTMGSAVGEHTQRLFERNAYRDYLELHGLSVQLTEALAEFWHDRVRTELGIAASSADPQRAIRDQDYPGSRYSFGYPACPNMNDRIKLVELLAPERIGVTLSEELQLHPEQSTDALILHHPEARYFNAT
ncbi:MAG: methionine synthase [Arachnia propionica]|nr:MAG: methionine synthase [Arachnia propionica]